MTVGKWQLIISCSLVVMEGHCTILLPLNQLSTPPKWPSPNGCIGDLVYRNTIFPIKALGNDEISGIADTNVPLLLIIPTQLNRYKSFNHGQQDILELTNIRLS